MNGSRVIEGISVYNTVSSIQKINRVFQKNFLTTLETLVNKDTELFTQIRSLYLDSQNDFARTVVNELFGGGIER